MVPRAVLSELEALEAREVPYARAARLFAGRFLPVASEGRGDSAVLAAARDQGAWVLTADRALAERLRRHGVDTVVPRDRTHLHLVRGDRPAPRPRTPDRSPRGKG